MKNDRWDADSWRNLDRINKKIKRSIKSDHLKEVQNLAKNLGRKPVRKKGQR